MKCQECGAQADVWYDLVIEPAEDNFTLMQVQCVSCVPVSIAKSFRVKRPPRVVRVILNRPS